jgi:hypothetical protein
MLLVNEGVRMMAGARGVEDFAGFVRMGWELVFSAQAGGDGGAAAAAPL